MLPAVKIGIVTAPAYDQTRAGPVKRFENLSARGAEQARQRDRREIERARRADQRVGGDQVLLGLPQVGPAREQFGRQPGRHRRATRDRRVRGRAGSACGLRPSSTDSASSCCAICSSSCGIVASEASYSDWLCASSICETSPYLKRKPEHLHRIGAALGRGLRNLELPVERHEIDIRRSPPTPPA